MKGLMSERAIPVLILLCLAPRLYAQGTVDFSNYGPGAPVTISTTPGTFNPANGQAGDYLGSDYTASLFFLNGTITDQTVFDDSNPILFSEADTQFLGVTGTPPDHGPNIDFAGYFGRGVYLSAASSFYVTIQVRAWYNGGGIYTSYAQALAAGQNVGESNPVAIFLAQGLAQPTPLDGLLPFTVGIVPEPSTLALFGWSGFSLWFFRRRK
jgi:hypothetical protein